MASIRSTLRRGETVWFVDYRVGGKRHRIDAENRKQAEAILREVNRKLEAVRTRERTGDTPLKDWWLEYLEWAKGHKRAAGYQRDVQIIQDLGVYLASQGVGTIRTVQHRHLSKYLLTVQERSTTATANRYQHTVKKTFALALEYGHLTVNPATRIREFREPSARPPRFFSVEELRGILWACVLMDPAFYRCVLFLVSTGARKGEAEALTWKDVDLPGKVVRLQTLKRAGRNTTRIVPIPETLLQALAWAKQRGLPPVDIQEGRRRLQRVLAVLGLQGGTLHTLRHTYASHLVQRGVSLYVVSNLLGHSNITTTQVYAHLVPDTFSDAVKVLPW